MTGPVPQYPGQRWRGRPSQQFPGQRPPPRRNYGGGRVDQSTGDFGDDIAGLAIGAAAGFIGQRIGRKMQAAMQDKVLPAMQARGEQVLRAQIEIAQRHPDLRACLTDRVIFLDGGRKFIPMPNLGTLTVEQAEALVASLRSG